ncbi:MAG: DUF3108 domain-containing protein [Halieaceae bacterium]|nr:DUF3108 domain-containing protein [Halieaceae bacterium]
MELLKPYKAVYKTKIKGIDILIERQLSFKDNGNLELRVQGKKFIFQVSEVSNFSLDEIAIVPISYKAIVAGGITRRKEIEFDSSAREINSLSKNQWFKLPYEDGVLDRLNVQEQLKLLLIANINIPKRISFRVADGSRIKDYNFLFAGEETLQANIGNIKTIRFTREFKDSSRLDTVWLAPDLDFLMIKHVHTEKGKSNQAMLLEASIEGFGKIKK